MTGAGFRRDCATSSGTGGPVQGLLYGALASQPTAPGLGSTISFRANADGVPGNSDLAGAILAAGARLARGGQDNLPPGLRYFGPDGAFTYEMVVKFDLLPGDHGLGNTAAMKESCPEVVLIDIQLPGMSGIQCVAKLKGIPPKRRC